MPESKLTEYQAARIEILRLKLERSRYRAEVVKWIAIAIGSVVSFAVIDYGKLKLEQFRAASDRQLRLIEAYSKATEAAEPEIWKRKLRVLKLFATDASIRQWVEKERHYIDEFAALDALYRETLKTASQLIDPVTVSDPTRLKARQRFEQLYWADLPFAGESSDVEKGMVQFRNALLAAEMKGANPKQWENLDGLLIELSRTLKEALKSLREKFERGIDSKIEDTQLHR